MVYHSKGGLTFSEVSLMTSKERKWWLKRLNEQFKREKEEIDKARKK